MAGSPASRRAELASPLLGKPSGSSSPRSFCGLLSGASFSWIGASLGGRHGLSVALRLEGGLARADAQFEQRRRERRGEPLLMSLLGVFWPSLARAAAYKLAADLVRYVPPLLLARLLSRMHTCGPLEAYSLAVGLPLTTLAQALLVNQYFWHALRTGVQVRGVLTAAILRRALAYRRCERADGGRLANMISSDCGRLNAACGSLNMVWSAPLQLCLALAMLWNALGQPVLGGAAVMLLLWPVAMDLQKQLGRHGRHRQQSGPFSGIQQVDAYMRDSLTICPPMPRMSSPGPRRRPASFRISWPVG
jgi:hypothetical protein